MTEREMLEDEKFWCENCCNWDKEKVQMDAYSTCKLTGTRVFAQESGKECKCFNVPAESVIVPPCKVGDKVYFLLEDTIPVHRWYIAEEKVTEVCSKGFFISGYCPPRDDLGEYSGYELFGKEIFLTKEAAEAEQALRKEDEGNERCMYEM